MRYQLNKIDMIGQIVIGEGNGRSTNALYWWKGRNKQRSSLDIALDPLEGTNFVANNLPNFLWSSQKKIIYFLHQILTWKIAIGSNLPNNLLDLDNTVVENIELLSKAKNKNDITACVLKRPRHENIINELKKIGVKIEFITDGDVYGVMAVCDEKSPIDIYMGIGGAPEGISGSSIILFRRSNSN